MTKLFITIISLFVSLTLCAQVDAVNPDIKIKWQEMPDSLCALKSNATIDSVESKYGSLYVKTSEATTMQMKIYNTSMGSKIICVINTYYSPEAESTLTFYDMEWNKTSNQPLDFSLFTNDGSCQKYFLPMLISARFAADNSIELILSDKNVTDEDKKLITFPLTKTLKWNGQLFE